MTDYISETSCRLLTRVRDRSASARDHVHAASPSAATVVAMATTLLDAAHAAPTATEAQSARAAGRDRPNGDEAFFALVKRKKGNRTIIIV